MSDDLPCGWPFEQQAMQDERTLDYRFRESCHKQGIHLSFQAPMYAGALRTKDGRLWQRGGGRLSCRSEMRMWRG